MMYFKEHYPNSQGPLNVANESKSQMSCEESNDMDWMILLCVEIFQYIWGLNRFLRSCHYN